MSLSFFDCNVRIGRGSKPVAEIPGSYENVEVLEKEMSYFGISDALVYHRCAQEGSLLVGNEILIKEIEGHKNLHPCWVISPHVRRPEDVPERLVEEMAGCGVKAVRLFPRAESYYGYPLREWMCGELLSALEENRVPVLFSSFGTLDETRSASIDRVHELCGNHPELPVVVGGWGFSMALHPLLERHQNLHLDISILSVHGELEVLCEKYGAQRLLFGTRFGQSPFTCAGAAITSLTMAKINEEDKIKIAGDNLRTLLGISSRKTGPAKQYDSVFIAPLRAGAPIEKEVVIDAHAHSGTDKSILPTSGPDGMVETMDRLGVNVACISGSGGIVSTDVSVTNDSMVEAVQAYPDRFIGYTRVDPHYPEEIRPELERRYRQAGVRNVKIHPAGHNYPVTGEDYAPAWEYARQHKSVVLVHSSIGSATCRPKMFDEVAAKYPDIQIIIGHSGNDRDGYKEAAEVAEKHRNIWLETSGWCMTSLGALEYVVDRIGSDRILFGTDFVFISEPFSLGAIAYAGISDEDKRKIMGLNAVELFGIENP